MATAPVSASPELLRRVVQLQILTIAWMTAEAALALFGAASARSPVLLGFGGDSAIELASAAVVLWRFRTHSDTERAEKMASRIAGTLLFVVAGCVVVAAGLSLAGFIEPRPSFIGIFVLIAAAVGMPWLARRKRALAAQTNSASLRADACESALCGYMAWIALAGLLINAIFHKSWADPVAALVLVPLVVKEGWTSVSASAKAHCCH